MSAAGIKTELPQFIRDMLSCPPPHGAGVHQWLFRVARQLHAHRDSETIVSLLTAVVDGCGRHVPEREIRDAVESACGCAWQPSGAVRVEKPRPKWPALNDFMVARILSNPVTEYDIGEASPVRIEGETPDAEWFIDGLFPGNPLLCVGRGNDSFKTAPREHFRGTLHDMSLIVPSPMTEIWGTRKSDGKESMHTLANTGPRAYLVTEFDSGTPDEQATIIWHLREFAPLVMILSSAGKSRHAWWNCHGTTEQTQGRFMRYAVSLGADPATWTRSQFVRLPMGWRHDKGARQEVLYFNPELATEGQKQ